MILVRLRAILQCITLIRTDIYSIDVCKVLVIMSIGVRIVEEGTVSQFQPE